MNNPTENVPVGQAESPENTPPQTASEILENNPSASSPPVSIRDILIGGIGFVVFLTLLTGGINLVGVDRLQALIRDAGVFAPLVYILMKALTYIFAPLTSGPIQVVAGTLFDSLWLGVLYTLIGEVMGGSVSFWIARRFGQPVVKRLVGEKGMRQVEDLYENQLGGWISLAIARVVLFSLWDFLSYAAGLARNLRFVTYLWVSIVLGALPTFFFVWLGTRAVEDSRMLYLAYGLVVIMVLVPVVGYKLITRLLDWSSSINRRSVNKHD